MRFIICLFLIFCYSNSYAQKILTVIIEDIEIGPVMGDDTFVFLSNGYVAKISAQKNELISELWEAKENRRWINISIDREREILDVEVLPDREVTIPAVSSQKGLNQFSPSVLKSLSSAQQLFEEMRYNSKESQCFNRAHVWSYELKKKHKINSSKMYLFFTRKYIREHKFEWWFHIAPLVHVTIGREIKERIMDKKYFSRPSTVKEWTDRFMKNDATCLTVERYSDYANYPESAQCFLMRTSMYFYRPLDLELLELQGLNKTTWVDEEIEEAYFEAFDIRY